MEDGDKQKFRIERAIKLTTFFLRDEIKTSSFTSFTICIFYLKIFPSFSLRFYQSLDQYLIHKTCSPSPWSYFLILFWNHLVLGLYRKKGPIFSTLFLSSVWFFLSFLFLLDFSPFLWMIILFVFLPLCNRLFLTFTQQSICLMQANFSTDFFHY